LGDVFVVVVLVADSHRHTEFDVPDFPFGRDKLANWDVAPPASSSFDAEHIHVLGVELQVRPYEASFLCLILVDLSV
jgi:hypothetical protein